MVVEAIKQLTDKVDGLSTQIQHTSVMLASMANAEFKAAEIKADGVREEANGSHVVLFRSQSSVCLSNAPHI